MSDATAAGFESAHGGCRLETYRPTGRATASGPWHDPMSTRRVEVRGEEGVALAVGARRLIEEPLVWRIERGEYQEQTSVDLDRRLFWSTVDRTLRPGHLPVRAVGEWAAQIQNVARSARPEDIVLLEDDPGTGDTTFACFTLTVRARLEAGLASFGFDETTLQKLSGLFEDELFPPLRVARRVATAGPAPALVDHEGPSLTRQPRLV